MKLALRLLACLAAACLAIPSAGCLGADSPEHFSYVQAIGFDRGKALPLSVSLLLQTHKDASDGASQSTPLLIKAECHTLLEAIETLSGSLPLGLNFTRTAMIVLSAELLMEPDAAGTLLDVPISQLRIRYNTLMLVSVSSAYDALAGVNNELDSNIPRLCANMSSYSAQTGLIPLVSLSQLFEAMRGRLSDVLLPLAGLTPDENTANLPGRDSVGKREYAYIGGGLGVESGMRTSLAGAALMQGGRMVGFLDGQNVQLALMATGGFCRGRRRITGANGAVLTVALRADKAPSTALSLVGTPSAVVSIPLRVYVETPDASAMSEAAVLSAVETALEDELDALLACCQARGCDALGFGREAVKRFRTVSDWEAYDWKAVYPTLAVRFEVRASLMHALGKSELE